MSCCARHTEALLFMSGRRPDPHLLGSHDRTRVVDGGRCDIVHLYHPCLERLMTARRTFLKTSMIGATAFALGGGIGEEHVDRSTRRLDLGLWRAGKPGRMGRSQRGRTRARCGRSRRAGTRGGFEQSQRRPRRLSGPRRARLTRRQHHGWRRQLRRGRCARTHCAPDLGSAARHGENAARATGRQRRAAVRARTGIHARRAADSGVRAGLARMAQVGAIQTGDQRRSRCLRSEGGTAPSRPSMAPGPGSCPAAATTTTRSVRWRWMRTQPCRACTTSGMAWKPMARRHTAAAGLYVDNEVGAATSTGVGEVIRNAGSFLVVELCAMGARRSRPAVKLCAYRQAQSENGQEIQVGFRHRPARRSRRVRIAERFQLRGLRCESRTHSARRQCLLTRGRSAMLGPPSREGCGDGVAEDHALSSARAATGVAFTGNPN